MSFKIFIIALLCIGKIDCGISDTDYEVVPVDSNKQRNEQELENERDEDDKIEQVDPGEPRYVQAVNDDNYEDDKIDPGEPRYVEAVNDDNNEDDKIDQVDPGEPRYVEAVNDDNYQDDKIEQVDPGEPRYVEAVNDDNYQDEEIAPVDPNRHRYKNKDFKVQLVDPEDQRDIEQLKNEKDEDFKVELVDPEEKDENAEENYIPGVDGVHKVMKDLKSVEKESEEQHKKPTGDDVIEQVDPGEHRYVQEFKDEEDEGIKDFKHHESDENAESLLREELERERAKHNQAGSVADYSGTHQHYEVPVNFDDFGRRFVLSYPYFEKNRTVDPAEMKLDKDVKEQLELKKHYFNNLTPLKAPPEFVLSIAKQSAILEATKPKNPSDDVITKDILRTGNFWNNVWKEDVDKKTLLRTSSKNSNMEKVTVEIEPGSKLYKLVSELKKRSPVLLYVINKKNAE